MSSATAIAIPHLGLFLTSGRAMDLAKDGRFTATEAAFLSSCPAVAFAQSTPGRVLRVILYIFTLSIIYWVAVYYNSKNEEEYLAELSRFIKSNLGQSPAVVGDAEPTPPAEFALPKPHNGAIVSRRNDPYTYLDMKFKPIECGGGGDCFFYAAVKQLEDFGCDNSSENMLSCRQKLSKFLMGELLAHLQHVRGQFSGAPSSDVDISELCALVGELCDDNCSYANMGKMFADIKRALQEMRKCKDFRKFIAALYDKKPSMRSLSSAARFPGGDQLERYINWISGVVYSKSIDVATDDEVLPLCFCFGKVVIYSSYREHGIHVVFLDKGEDFSYNCDEEQIDFLLGAEAPLTMPVIQPVDLNCCRRAWEVFAVCNESGERIPFPKITCVACDGDAMTVEQMRAHALRSGKSAEELCKEMANDVKQMHLSILSHAWKHSKPIGLYNTGGHWVQIVPQNL